MKRFLFGLMLSAGLLVSGCNGSSQHNTESDTPPKFNAIQGISSYLMETMVDRDTCVSYFASRMKTDSGYILTVRLADNGKPLLDQQCLSMKEKVKVTL